MLNEIQDLFQLQDSLIITPRACNAFQIVMITKNQTEKVVKLSKHRQLISNRLLPESIKKRVYSCTNVRIFWRKVVIDQNLLMNDLLHITGADGVVF